MATSYPQIVVTGDSISQQAFKIGGYGAALVDAYQGKADVINRGMGGYNSKQLLRKLKEDFQYPSGEIKLFVIHIGTNDATTRGIQHIPVDDFTQNLAAIVTLLKDSQLSAQVILITPSTVHTDSWLAAGRAMGLPDEFGNNRTPEQSKLIRDAVLAVGKNNNVAVVDAWKLHDDAVNNGEITTEELFSDGLHYSTRGYDYVNKALLKTIKSEHPTLSPDTLPEGFTTFLLYDNESNPEAQTMLKMFTERMEAVKQAALGNTEQ